MSISILYDIFLVTKAGDNVKWNSRKRKIKKEKVVNSRIENTIGRKKAIHEIILRMSVIKFK